MVTLKTNAKEIVTLKCFLMPTLKANAKEIITVNCF